MNLYMRPNFHEALPKNVSILIGFYYFDHHLMLCPVQNPQKYRNIYKPNKMHKFHLQWLRKDENKQKAKVICYSNSSLSQEK